MSKKKLLILVDWYEPGYKAGGPIQSVRNFVEAMQDEYEISVLTSDRDINESVPYEGIAVNQWVNRAPGIAVYYANVASLYSKKICELIVDRNPDFIYLNSLFSYRFSIIPLILKWRKKISAAIVLAPRGMLQEGAMQIKTTKKKLFLQLLGFSGIIKKIRFHATDRQEKKDIIQYFPDAGSVTEIFNFSAPLPELPAPILKIPGTLKAVYISRITQKKNILYILNTLNKVSDRAFIEFSIYGEIEEMEYWQEAQSIIKDLPENIKAIYKGPLPHTAVISVLGAHHIFILPTKGENFGHAIFEAFSAGRPVLISNKTPWKGLKEIKTGWDLSLEDPDSWVAALEEATGFDQPAFNTWSENCWKYAGRHIHIADLKKEYIQLFS